MNETTVEALILAINVLVAGSVISVPLLWLAQQCLPDQPA